MYVQSQIILLAISQTKIFISIYFSEERKTIIANWTRHDDEDELTFCEPDGKLDDILRLLKRKEYVV